MAQSDIVLFPASLSETYLLEDRVVNNDPVRLSGSGQRVVVVTESWDATQGRLRAYSRQNEEWRQNGEEMTVSLGRNGSAWGLGLHPAQTDEPQKREGDGKSPAGVFALKEVFGYQNAASLAMPYWPMKRSHFCIDQPQSPFYNRIVDAAVVGAAVVADSTEPMRRDLRRNGDRRYRFGVVVEHNPTHSPAAGSCIFIHLRLSSTDVTAGCTALDEGDMIWLVHWLNSAERPQFVLLPEHEYVRFAESWDLPSWDESASDTSSK